MLTTLAERVKLAMEGPPRVLGKDLAAACGVAAASVSDWRNGATQSIDGPNLIRAAEYLKVNAKWLAHGTGPMRKESVSEHMVQEPAATYAATKPQDKLTTELVYLFEKLDKLHKHEFLGQLRGFVYGLGAHIKDPPPEQIEPANIELTGTHD